MNTRPDWVLYGLTDRQTGRCIVIASRDLDRARLHWDTKLHRAGPGTYESAPTTFELTANGRNSVTADGDTFLEALAALFKEWAPEPGWTPAIEPAQLDPIEGPEDVQPTRE